MINQNKPVKQMEPIYQLFGARVRQIRDALGMTQDELRKKVGLTRTSIANIEAGRQRVLLADVQKFSNAFNVNPSRLMKGMWL